MKYNITFKSCDINRPNVLIYGKEELVLFEINVDVNKNVDFTQERAEFFNRIIDEEYINSISEEERTLISEEANRLIPNDFSVYYTISIYTNSIMENLCVYLNEHNNISEDFKTYKKDVNTLENLDRYLIENTEDTGLLEYEGMLEYHTTLKNLIEEKMDAVCERYGWEYQKINWEIPEPGNSIEEHINMLINTQTSVIEDEEIPVEVEETQEQQSEPNEIIEEVQNGAEENLVDEIPESEENNSEEVVESETTEETIENEQPIE